jgi:hypothetical protein
VVGPELVELEPVEDAPILVVVTVGYGEPDGLISNGWDKAYIY